MDSTNISFILYHRLMLYRLPFSKQLNKKDYQITVVQLSKPIKLLPILSYILLSLLICFPVISLSQNVALNKKYSLSEKPNYKLAASKDLGLLTDGKFTKGHFWTKETTLGWRNKTRIRITIDLEQNRNIGSLGLSSAAGKSSVHFPENVYVFISRNGKSYTYAGDIMKNKESRPEKYVSKKLFINNLNQVARYITLVIIPDGKYFFTDEIQIEESKEKKSEEICTQTLKFNTIDETINFLTGYEENLQESQYEIVSELKETDDAKKRSPQVNQLPLPPVFIKEITDKYNTPFVIEKVAPWKDLTEFYIPENDFATLDYEFSVINSFKDYGSFVVTNTSNIPQNISFNTNEAGSKLVKIDIFEVPFVYSRTGKKIADPLIKLKSKLPFAPGETKMFLFSLKGVKSGNDRKEIIISNNQKKVPISVNTNVVKLREESHSTLNTNVWSYLNYPLIKDRKTKAAEDLKQHHINTVVVRSSHLPKIGGSDFQKLLDYMDNFKEVDNILLYFSLKSKSLNTTVNGDAFLTPEWKNSFKKWYFKLTQELKSKYGDSLRIYFYPFDEVQEESHINEFKELITWTNNQRLDINFFATLGNEKAIKTLLPLLDLAQIYNKPRLIKDLPKTDTEIWQYEVAENARSLSSYSFYRLMAWNAFLKGNQGIGFWNYADNRKEQSALLSSALTKAPKIDYSVVYFDEQDGLYSSRRWEAFSKGVEDYKILKIYSEIRNEAEAIQKVKEVLAHPKNIELADQVIQSLLKEIYKNKKH